MNYLKFFLLIIVLFMTASCKTDVKQSVQKTSYNEVLIDSLYNNAMAFYDKRNYSESAKQFDRFFEEHGELFYNGGIYNAACVYSLNKESEKAFKWLNYVADKKYYANIDHIKSDSDLKTLHAYKDWKPLLHKVEDNKQKAPMQKRRTILKALQNAKKLLLKDNGNLWNVDLWSPNVLVIDYDRTIYSLDRLQNSDTKDSLLFYKKFKDDELVFVNTTQKYDNKQYATVMINSIKDSSATIIHELFHLKHFQYNDTLKANPVNYLDNHEARILLRLEFKALKNGLKAINSNESKESIETYLKDALTFRKVRQSENSQFFNQEISLETVEALANYTGIKLSNHVNKYDAAINEIDERESAKTLARPFPYATGPAYGLLFDYLDINWRGDLKKTYDFLSIYEEKQSEKPIKWTDSEFKESKKRNDFERINNEELIRKREYDSNVNYYSKMFLEKPTLTAKLEDRDYALMFNMNGTIHIDSLGTIYSGATGSDKSGNNFGNFRIIEGFDVIGKAGVLKITGDRSSYVFPLPEKVEGNKVFGSFYEITLNPGWEIGEPDSEGNQKIIKSKKG